MKILYIKLGRYLAFFSALLFSLISYLPSAQAAFINNNDDKYETGKYGIDDIVALSITAADFILGITGSLALVMFIYGGATMLISAGSSDKVNKAKKIFIAAIVGMILVFSGKMIIDTVVQTLTAK